MIRINADTETLPERNISEKPVIIPLRRGARRTRERSRKLEEFLPAYGRKRECGGKHNIKIKKGKRRNQEILFVGFAEFLERVNADSLPIESVGCEKGVFPSDVEGPKIKIGSYVDVIFTERALNDRPENALLLASLLANAVEGSEKRWADVSLVLQRNKGLPGSSTPWGLMLQIKNYGQNEEQARKLWAGTLSKLGSAIALLPRDFQLAE